jgi:phosphatidylserine/phosphatidylglycerophosphate/cardiolipin synthase-like enzyme
LRVTAGDARFGLKAIAGTHVVLMAMNMDAATRQGLRGFAIKRGVAGKPQTWLTGIKYFPALVPTPVVGATYPSRQQPFQTFLWSDYGADPNTRYDFTIVALYGDLDAMEERHTLPFSITTEPDFADGHGVFFNRGAIASHAFATDFHNKTLTEEMANNVSDDGKLLDGEAQWLSRGLAEACLAYINETQRGDGLRVCAYEFTYLPVLAALERAHERGVDVEIIFHDTKKDNDSNRAAIAAAGLPAAITHPRTRTAIPHNKFIVRLASGKPKEVWTGSTNFTSSGFFGQTNVGHRVADDKAAKTYLDYWNELVDDPPHSVALKNAVALTPNPPNVVPPASVTPFYSPRIADNMLDWYGGRIDDTAGLAMMTIPFNVAPKILTALAKPRDAMRFVILEDPPSKEVQAAEKQNRGKLLFSNGAILGKTFIKQKSSFGGAKVAPIPNSDLDKWFIEEELDRPTNAGHVFFVHAKVLVIDPLSDDPLVCSGSANFSSNSLTANDENMLLIRGNTRTADIYMTELDRIFRHFYARDVINDTATQQENRLALDDTDKWMEPNFKTGSYKNNRRLLFFPDASPKPWSTSAAADPDAFADEDERAAAVRTAKNAKAKERRAGAVAPPAKAKPAGKKAKAAAKSPVAKAPVTKSPATPKAKAKPGAKKTKTKAKAKSAPKKAKTKKAKAKTKTKRK